MCLSMTVTASGSMTLQTPFTSDLANKTSQEYLTLSNQFTSAVSLFELTYNKHSFHLIHLINVINELSQIHAVKLERNWEDNLQFFSELITTQLRISHGVTTTSLYLSSSPCKATSFTDRYISNQTEPVQSRYDQLQQDQTRPDHTRSDQTLVNFTWCHRKLSLLIFLTMQSCKF